MVCFEARNIVHKLFTIILLLENVSHLKKPNCRYKNLNIEIYAKKIEIYLLTAEVLRDIIMDEIIEAYSNLD